MLQSNLVQSLMRASRTNTWKSSIRNVGLKTTKPQYAAGWNALRSPAVTLSVRLCSSQSRSLHTPWTTSGWQWNRQIMKSSLSNFQLRMYSTEDLPAHEQLSMPALSPTMEKGTLVEWKINIGEQVSAGDVLAVVETDKATIDFEATEDGFMAKQFIEAGTADIPVGKPLAIICEEEEDVGKFADASPVETESSGGSESSSEEPKPSASEPEPTTSSKSASTSKSETSAPAKDSGRSSGGRLITSPAARSLAAANNVDLNQVRGTGPGGRIIKADVLEAMKGGAQAPSTSTTSTPAAPAPKSSAAAFEDVSASNIRKVTAQRLTESKQQVPHYYQTIECNVSKLMALRKEFNDRADGAYKVSVNDFVLKASALALRKVPAVNSSWVGDAIRYYNSVDINVAVNTSAGLFTPLVSDADNLGLATIASRVRELAEKAHKGKLAPMEMQSGTFTVSNLGMFGISQFTAVINPPQAAILAVGGSEDRVIVAESDEEGNPTSFKVQPFMKVTLSCDHRVVDGAIGAEWLKEFKKYMEDPTNMLL